jgi:hypothetical protein
MLYNPGSQPLRVLLLSAFPFLRWLVVVVDTQEDAHLLTETVHQRPRQSGACLIWSVVAVIRRALHTLENAQALLGNVGMKSSESNREEVLWDCQGSVSTSKYSHLLRRMLRGMYKYLLVLLRR